MTSVRAATFPLTLEVDRDRLASQGFVYTTEGHCVCESCGYRAVDIYRMDLQTRHRFANPECPFVITSGVVMLDVCGSGKTSLYNMYERVEDRMASFQYWPRALNQKPANLVDAGFYYTKIGDRVRCYACSLMLSEWMPTDDPMDEHAHYAPNCPVVTTTTTTTTTKV